MKVFTDPISQRRMAVGKMSSGIEWQVVDYGDSCQFGLELNPEGSKEKYWDIWTERTTFENALMRFRTEQDQQ